MSDEKMKGAVVQIFSFYDVAGRRTATKDANNALTQFDYDNANRMIATINPNHGRGLTQVRGAGAMLDMRNPGGRIGLERIDKRPGRGRQVGYHLP